MLYPKDSRVRVEKHSQTLTIEWKHGNAAAHLATVIGIVLIIMAWFGSEVPNPGDELHPVIHLWGPFIGMSIFMGLPFIAIGLILAFNRTVIHADHHRLTAGIYPFRVKRPVILHGQALSQFFVAPSSGYRILYVMDREHYQRPLASSFPSSFAAYQVCHELQDWYGLQDLPVYGHTDLPDHPGPRSK